MMHALALAHGLAIENGRVLLVASRYASHPQGLWNLPGGRVEAGELLPETVLRETREETGLHAAIGDLAYLSESYDGPTHVTAAIFDMRVTGTIVLPHANDHVERVEWVALDALAERLAVAVIREPLLAHLNAKTRYFGTYDAGITIRW